VEHVVDWAGPAGSAILRRPEHEVQAGLVMLHGAADGRARQPLFDHLAHLLAPLGVATLSYDRHPATNGDDTALQVQADDPSAPWTPSERICDAQSAYSGSVKAPGLPPSRPSTQ